MTLDEAQEILKPLFLTGPNAVQVSSDTLSPLCFSSCLYAHSVENTALLEEGTRGTVTQKIPSLLGLEMHLVVGFSRRCSTEIL